MTRALLGIAGLGLIAFALSGCKRDHADTPSVEYTEAISLTSGGPPDQEVASDYYKTLTRWAVDYPQLRPAIIHALAGDGTITYAEYDKISGEEETLQYGEGEKKWDGYIMSYRNAVKKAAS